MDAANLTAATSPNLEHRALRQDDFWNGVPGFQNITAEEFHSHTFQARHTVTNVRQLRDLLQGIVPESFYGDIEAGLKKAPMALRISPYLLSLVDWRQPYEDPIRTQFLPVASQQFAESSGTATRFAPRAQGFPGPWLNSPLFRQSALSASGLVSGLLPVLYP